jgi:integrase/recombinase XerD
LILEGKVVQDAREVRTKFSKTFTTWFFPVGEEVRQEVFEWLSFLQREDEPLFAATEVVPGKDQQFEAAGLSRSHWSTASPIRKIFKEAFTKAGLSYFHPHSFRRTVAQLGERLCHTPEEFKAWSQNLGHEKVLTTFSSYGEVARDRQAKLIRKLGQMSSQPSYPKEAFEQVLHYVQTQHDRHGVTTSD